VRIEGVRRHVLWAGLLLLGFLAVAAAIVVLTRGSSSDVPQLSVLGRATGVRVLANQTGGSEIDTGLDKRTYRYAVLSGTDGESSIQLVRREVAFLVAHGWRNAEATVMTSQPAAGGGTTAGSRKAPIGTPASTIGIEKDDDVQASIDIYPNGVGTLEDELGLTPFLNAANVRAAAAHRQPLLFVTLRAGR
jgi:hypothetical protein